MSTILVAEDSRTQQFYIKDILERAGHVVLVAHDGKEGLNVVYEKEPALVITDIHMPEMGGYEMCAKLKNSPEYGHIPVILLSDLAELKDIVVGLGCQADNYIIKPFTEDEILHTVSKTLSESTGDTPQSDGDSMKLSLDNETYLLNSNARQILNFLLSIYENAIRKNKSMLEMQNALVKSNADLEQLAKQFKASQLKFQTLVQTVPDIIYHVDENGNFLFLNHSVSHFGYKPEDLIDKHFSSILSPAQVDKVSLNTALPAFKNQKSADDDFLKLFDERRSGERKTEGLEVMIRHKAPEATDECDNASENGKLLPAEVNSAGMYEVNEKNEDSKFLGSVGVIRDITERKKTEQELVIAKEQAVKANEFKSNFLANMSHEIRTPMNAILGLTHLALQTGLNDKQKDYLNKINSSCQSLLVIINDILDFSKIEAGKLNIENTEFFLDDVLDNLTGMFGKKAEDKGVEFLFFTSIECPNALVGDQLRLGQVLINLVSNALKFTEKGEVVIVTELDDKASGAARLKFSVKDTGIGLNKEQSEGLFRPFEQADASTTRKYGGTGLGLAICKRLVELMNGDIWVESEPGKGSSFIFTAEFGYRKATHRTIFDLFPEPRDVKALVVDDSNTAREFMTKTLESLSLSAVPVNSGEKALKEIEQNNGPNAVNPYNIVLMDWKMPGLTGIETAKIIKENTKLSHIPSIIMVTAYGADFASNEDARDVVDGFLAKPVNSSRLLDNIFTALGHAYIVNDKKKSIEKEKATFANVSGSHVLLVEDNSINQQVARELLESYGVEVSTASTGKEALDSVANHDFDMVFMDIQMQEMDGYQATKLIREEERFKNLPIIAMTANAMTGDKQKCLDAGMDDYISKPINPNKLYEALKTWSKNEPAAMPAPTETGAASGCEKTFLQSIKGIDTEHGIKRLMGNVKLYKKITVTFGRDFEGSPDRIKTALKNNDTEKAQMLAHTIKGVAGTIGADKVYIAASNLESCIKKRDAENYEKYIKGFQNEIDPVVKSINETKAAEDAMKKESPNKPASVNAVNVKKLEPLFVKLEAMLRDGDSDAIEQTSLIMNELAGSKLYETMEFIKRKIEDYDFDEAVEAMPGIFATLGVDKK